MAGIRQLKNIALSLIQERDHAKLMELANENFSLTRALISYLYNPDELICWRTIEALGKVSAAIAKSDMETIRVLIRRLFWTMNDESGSIGWNSPSAIGEILYNIPPLIDEFGRVLASFLREEPFEKGAHWAMARILPLNNKLVYEYTNEFVKSLDDKNPAIRGYSLMILKPLNFSILGEKREILAGDTASFLNYDFAIGDFKTITIAEIYATYKPLTQRG
jgi:hypothetical protein